MHNTYAIPYNGRMPYHSTIGAHSIKRIQWAKSNRNGISAIGSRYKKGDQLLTICSRPLGSFKCNVYLTRQDLINILFSWKEGDEHIPRKVWWENLVDAIRIYEKSGTKIDFEKYIDNVMNEHSE